MIDINKYKGHTEFPWIMQSYEDYDKFIIVGPNIKIDNDDVGKDEGIANAKLVEDIPLLLNEVIRLQKENKYLKNHCIDLDELDRFKVKYRKNDSEDFLNDSD